MAKYLSKSDELKVREIDKGVKEPFSFAWLEKTVKIPMKGVDTEMKLREYIRKVDQRGMCACLACDLTTLNYGNRGSVALVGHTKTTKHMKNVERDRQSTKLDTFVVKPKQSDCDVSATSTSISEPATQMPSPSPVV